MTSQSLDTSIKGFLPCIMLEWVELTDVGISEWTSGGGRQVITSWSHSRPTEQGMTLIQYINLISDNCMWLMSCKHNIMPLRGI